MSIRVSGSIVLYKTNPRDLFLSVESIINSEFLSCLFLIDNSPDQELKDKVKHPKVVYVHNPSNPGFGAAHNIALKKSIENNIDYHFVINPDISASHDIVTPIVHFLEENKDIGMLMPKILNLDGSTQYLPKLLPSPFSILLRKLRKPNFIYQPFIQQYELRDVPDDIIYSAPILSGCFTVFRVKALREIGLYDDRFFMYFEDWDLSRRMYEKFKTIYFPKVSVFHGYDSGANKNKHLFKIFVKSAFLYFNKWGWFFDLNRIKINNKTLEQFK